MKADIVIGNYAIAGSNNGPGLGNGEVVVVRTRQDMDVLDALPAIDRAIINYGRYKMAAQDYFVELSKDPATRDDMMTLVDPKLLHLGNEREKRLAQRQARLSILLTRQATRRRPRR